MLPFCDRSVSVERKDVAPVWTRSFPINKEPPTLGQHLKKKRFVAGMRQKQIAAKLGISARTLSLWECDQIVPAWEYQPRLIAYLGFNPFDGLIPRKPKGNETSGVAFLSPAAPATIGQRIQEFRLKSRKAWKQLGSEY
jgi:transcriptional regulator with XRE-family HTH domain